ncbi:MAG: porin [Rhodomicrobiaceae bacterium]
MFKKLLLTTAFSLALLPVAGTANAADLGGDCCADLEERVAVLEATTARKGNRKVSLTISGWVTQQLMGWDDGIDSDVYVGTSAADLGNRLHFDGSAKINSDWSAGYMLRINITNDQGFSQTATNDDAGAGISVLNSNMWIKSETYGRLRWGRQSHASDDAWVDLSGAGSIFAANLVTFDGNSFALVGKGTNTRTAATWGTVGWCQTVGLGIYSDCGGDRTNSIRYDTPTIAGFTLSASWGEDDFWDVALRHSGQVGDFKITGSVAYQWNDDNRFGTALTTDFYQVNFAFLHQPSGIFGSVHYGYEDPEAAGVPDGDHLYLKAGVRTKLNQLGSTVFYGEYGYNKDAYNTAADIDANTAGNQSLGDVTGVGTVTGTTFDRYGLGVVQEIDAASMALWVKWKHYETEIDGTAGTFESEDLDIFAFGGAIFF